MADPIAQPERKWPAIYALATAWSLPATTTQRTAHVSLPRAFGVSMLALMLTIFVGCFLGAYSDVSRSGDALIDSFAKVVDLIADDALRYPREFFLASGFVLLLTQSVLFALAMITAPFGARDERLRDSFRHALRRTWLQTAQVPIAVLLAGLFITELQIGAMQRQEALLAEFERLHPEPALPADTNNQEAMAEYNQEMSKYWSAQWDYVRNHPGFQYYAYVDEISFQIVSAAVIWFVWALYRGVSAHRPVVPREHDPLCRICGYDLTASPPDGMCAECGSPIAQTFGPDATPGAPWEKRKTAGRLRTYLQTFRMAIREPIALGQRLSIDAPRGHALRFMVVNVAISIVFATGATYYGLILWWMQRSVASPMYGLVPGLMEAAFASYGYVLLMLVVVGLMALAIAVHIRSRDGRNVLPWIGQMAAYGSAYLLLWFASSAIVYFAISRRYAEWLWLEEVTGIPADAIQAFLWTCPNVIAAIGYLLYSFRAARGVRYAWR